VVAGMRKIPVSTSRYRYGLGSTPVAAWGGGEARRRGMDVRRRIRGLTRDLFRQRGRERAQQRRTVSMPCTAVHAR
jgi:hypothetical protein